VEGFFGGIVWFVAGVGLTMATDGFGTLSASTDADAGSSQGQEESAGAAPTTGEPGEKAGAAVDPKTVAQLHAQMEELERLLIARRTHESTGAAVNGPAAEGSEVRVQNNPCVRTGSKLDGDLADLVARQNQITQGEKSEREREIDREAEARALKAVSDIRVQIGAAETLRKHRMEEIIKKSQ
jgi:hypothetical protein